MDWNVNFDELDGAAIVRTSGVFNVADHARMVADIVGRAEWHPGHPILFDHRALDFDGAGYDQMLGARNNHLAHESQIRNARSAILMKSESDFGIGRQFQLLAEGRVGAELRIFADEVSARHWLFEKA